MPDFAARWQRPDVLQAIFDQLSDAIFLYDKNLHLAGVNKSGEQLLGLSAEEMMGKPVWELFPLVSDESNKYVQPGSGQSWLLPTGTFRVHVGNGRERRVIIRNIELLDEAGALEGVVATAAEMTETPELDERHRIVEAPSVADPVVTRHRSAATLAGILVFILILVLAVSRYLINSGGKPLSPAEQQRAAADKEKREATVRFNAMTPAQHIERAKSALKPGATLDIIAEGLRHLKAVPTSAPESGRAKTLERDLTKAQNLAAAQSLIDAASSGDFQDGMDKVQSANSNLVAVAQQYPGDKDVARLSRAAQTAAEQLAMRFPQEFASAETKLVDFTWEKGGFGTVMIANFTVRNDSPVDVADMKIRCDHSADGVVVDQNSGTAYGVVKAHSTARFPNVNMGFLASQGGNSRPTKTDCEILGLKLAAESQTFGSRR